MTEARVFDSIYANYDRYLAITNRILGETPYNDEVVSECVEKLLKNIRSGKTNITDIQHKNTADITFHYFGAIVMNRCLDIKRAGKNKKRVPFEDRFIDETGRPYPQPDLIPQEIIDLINSKFETYKDLDIRKNHLYLIWKHHFIKGTSLNQISIGSGIGWRSLERTRNEVKLIIEKWLKEEQKLLQAKQLLQTI